MTYINLTPEELAAGQSATQDNPIPSCGFCGNDMPEDRINQPGKKGGQYKYCTTQCQRRAADQTKAFRRFFTKLHLVQQIVVVMNADHIHWQEDVRNIIKHYCEYTDAQINEALARLISGKLIEKDELNCLTLAPGAFNYIMAGIRMPHFMRDKYHIPSYYSPNLKQCE